ncbi:MAG TPA: TlyA family RNA methyltransferase [Kofleriaceae bacterium]|nr:TlyA family RNA methyltransferase [Kofleriaceae bacterium]
MANRKRLDKLLVARGLATSVEHAAELVSAGAVTVAGMPAKSPAAQVDLNVGIVVRAPDADDEYVSRGAHKLLAGLDAFGIDPRGMVALDIGASTGGFTDVLLRRGASRVYAIDVGYGQLAWSLRQDPRVVVLERQNVKTLDRALVPDIADIAVIDVSFISLTSVLPSIAALMTAPDVTAGKPIIALVKPQFEVPRDQVADGGVVREEAFRLGAIDKVATWARSNGFTVGPHVTSPITGPAGNIEYLLLLRIA